MVEEAEVVKPGNMRKVCSAAAAAPLARSACAQARACLRLPVLIRPPWPVCCSRHGASRPAGSTSTPGFGRRRGRCGAEDKVSYLSMRANTIKRHGTGQPWAHGRKLRKEQQRRQQRRQQQQKQQQKQEVTGHVSGSDNDPATVSARQQNDTTWLPATPARMQSERCAG